MLLLLMANISQIHLSRVLELLTVQIPTKRVDIYEFIGYFNIELANCCQDSIMPCQQL